MAKVTGQVLDNESKKGIPYATVYYQGSKGTATDKDGFFSYQSSVRNDKALRISSAGYKSVTVPLNEFGFYVLTPDTKQLEDVVIKTKKKTKGPTSGGLTASLPPKVTDEISLWIWVLGLALIVYAISNTKKI